jgi:trans-aconitate methyltransferase
MSLTVTNDMLKSAQRGELTHEEFIACIAQSLPRAWEIVEKLVDELRSQSTLTHAVHAPEHMEDEQRNQLLRLLASSSMRSALEQHCGLRFEFQNCHKLAAFRDDAVGSPAYKYFVSPEAQILAQSPELVDC